MATGPKLGKLPWYKALIRPERKFGEIFKHGTGNFILLFMLMSGYALVHTWADLFNLGDYYIEGQIMSFAFVLGPFLGLFFTFATALFLMISGCLLDPDLKVKFQYIEVRPWIPFRWVWIRIFGRQGYDTLWDRPGFKHVKMALSYIYSAFTYLIANVSGGKTPLTRLLTGLGWAQFPLFIVAVVLALAFTLFDAAQFSSGADLSPLFLAILLYLIQFVGWAAFLYLCIALVRYSFKLPWWKGIVATVFSLGMAGFFSWFLFIYLFGIKLFV